MSKQLRVILLTLLGSPIIVLLVLFDIIKLPFVITIFIVWLFAEFLLFIKDGYFTWFIDTWDIKLFLLTGTSMCLEFLYDIDILEY